MDPAGLPALIEAIRHLDGLEATWLESVPVHGTHEGQTVWEGEVQVFEVNHPKAFPGLRLEPRERSGRAAVASITGG